MFDIGWGELMLIGIVALIAIGPKELPGTLRALGQWMAKIRGMAAEFQNQFQEAMREAELAELRKEVDEMADKAAEYTRFDPVGDISKDLEKAADLPDLGSPVPHDQPAVAPTPAADASAAELPPPTAVEPAAEPVSTQAEGADSATTKPDAGKAA